MPILRDLYDVVDYYLRSLIYISPALVEYVKRKAIGASKYRCSRFWDRELAGPKELWLRGTLSIDVRNAIIAILIRHHAPGAQSVLDVGCGGGLLALTLSSEGICSYVGLDISRYAIKAAKKEILDNKKMHNATFHVCDLCDFTPERDSLFDVVVFNEVLYYLDVREAIAQLDRYLNWLSPNGVFCISMKHDPKSKIILQAALRRFELVRSILFQSNREKVKYRIFISSEKRAYLIACLRRKLIQ